MRRITLLFVFSLFLSQIIFAQSKDSHLAEWQNNKYAMFIHFGLYSQLGGVWKGKEITSGYSEQIQSHAGIFSDEYAQVAEHFIPNQWNADSIVALAKRAGMRSIVITAKHHDGFCMFKTQTTDFNIVDATPFKRDVVKELSEACRRGGIHFGLYFSLIDWHYPQAYPISSHNADFITPEHHAYNKRQLTELLTHYGPISELWFDMGSLPIRQSEELRALVKKYQPNCMISGRLGNDQGDFCVMGDNEYPDYAIATPWQVPASMYNETWGYRSWQKNVPLQDKVAEKLSGLVNTVARGGNYLLNIGPKGDGSVVEFEKDVLLAIGSWLKVNGEAIYNTRPVKIPSPPYGEMTNRGNKIYFFLLHRPAENKIVLKGLASKINRVYPLDAPEDKLTFKQNSDSLDIVLPGSFRLNTIRVIVIESQGPVSLKPQHQLALRPLLILNNQNAQHHYSFSGIDYYSSYRSTVKNTWDVYTTASQKVQPEIIYSDEEKGRQALLSLNGTPVAVSFSGGETISLPRQDITWEPIAVSGPFGGFMDHLNDDLKNLDTNKSWGGKEWKIRKGWTNTETYPQHAEMFQNWYWLQDITAPKATQTLIRLPTNDGVAVYLNGQELYIINNPKKDTAAQTTILLPLKAGKNQLLVKYFNRFNKHVSMGVFTDIPQVLYKKTLPKITLEKNKTYHIGLYLPAQYPKHENVHTPNFSIRLAY